MFLLDSESFLLTSEAFLRESETFLLEAEAFLLDSDTFLREEEAPLLDVDAFLLELEAPLLALETFFLAVEDIATFLNFGPEDIFKALAGTRFPLMRMDGISCFDLNEEPLLAVILSDCFFAFLIATFFGFAEAIILDDLRLLETFLLLLIGEDEDFLDSLLLFDIDALLKSSSSSLLTSRCILLDLDLTIFLSLLFNVLWLTGQISGKFLNL